MATPDLDSFVEQVSKIPDNTYFRLRAVTFDNVPWAATMKKNDHYVCFPGLAVFFSLCLTSLLFENPQFPMSEYIKDPSAPAGWRTVSYDPREDKRGAAPDAANLNADAMDEVFEGGGSDIEPDFS